MCHDISFSDITAHMETFMTENSLVDHPCMCNLNPSMYVHLTIGITLPLNSRKHTVPLALDQIFVSLRHSCFLLPKESNAQSVCLNTRNFKTNMPSGAQMGTSTFAFYTTLGAENDTCVILNDTCAALRATSVSHRTLCVQSAFHSYLALIPDDICS